jgi:hypothetical protein
MATLQHVRMRLVQRGSFIVNDRNDGLTGHLMETHQMKAA